MCVWRERKSVRGGEEDVNRKERFEEWAGKVRVGGEECV
jgi:hypothetical protein